MTTIKATAKFKESLEAKERIIESKAGAESKELFAKFATQMRAKGLKVKAEKAYHTNITISLETDNHSAQNSFQIGENFTENDADKITAHVNMHLLKN